MHPNVFETFDWPMMGMNKEVVSDLYSAVNNSFSFIRAPEGESFWSDLINRLGNYYNGKYKMILRDHDKSAQYLPGVGPIRDVNGRRCAKGAEYLADAFAWEYSIEGWDWWHNVYLRLLYQSWAVQNPFAPMLTHQEVHRMGHVAAAEAMVLKVAFRNESPEVRKQIVRLNSEMSKALGGLV